MVNQNWIDLNIQQSSMLCWHRSSRFFLFRKTIYMILRLDYNLQCNVMVVVYSSVHQLWIDFIQTLAYMTEEMTSQIRKQDEITSTWLSDFSETPRKHWPNILRSPWDPNLTNNTADTKKAPLQDYNINLRKKLWHNMLQTILRCLVRMVKA